MNTIEELNSILKNQSITTVYQPIISLENGEVIGYEALSRGPENSELQSPNKLFSIAKQYNKTWELEYLCRLKAIERARNRDETKLLFVNIDPTIIKDEKFKKGFTKDFLSLYNISPDSIIFEITEKTAIEDYASFKKALDTYTMQGYKIAIDDMGSGYSGLKMLTETKPNYVKIDMDLIRNIHKDSFKKALIKMFVNLSEVANMKLIAEGIEVEEELLTLINLGVHCGQGYYIQRPDKKFKDINEKVVEMIKKNNDLKNISFTLEPFSIGDIARCDNSFQVCEKCNVIQNYFSKIKALGACIVNESNVVGLLMKHRLDSMLATQYGVALFSKRPVELVMDTNPLIVDYYTDISEVSKIAMERENERLYDHIIVTNEDKYYGVVSIKDLLKHTTMIEKKYARELNPLTGLPGNYIIESNLKKFLCVCKNECILYFDLDNFKIYNDVYGFENGDSVLKFTAQIIYSKIKEKFPCNSFIGHIGGDDFICIIESTKDKCEEICGCIINEFDRNISKFFNEKDNEKGYLEGIDRNGLEVRFNLTSITIAGIFGRINNFRSTKDLAKYASLIKKEAKKIKKSSYLIKDI